MIRVICIVSLMFVFMGCVHNPAYVEKEYDLSSDFEDIIVFETKGPYQKAEFVIDGHSDGSGVLHLFHPPYPEEEKRDKYRNGIIIEGDIKLEFKKTWYMNEVLVKYIVFEPGTGRLRIRFRVF